jgi:HK97 family phage major capsid protein
MLQSQKLKQEATELLRKASVLLASDGFTEDDDKAVDKMFEEADNLQARAKKLELTEKRMEEAEFVPVGQYVTPGGPTVKQFIDSNNANEPKTKSGWDYVNSPEYKTAYAQYMRKGERLGGKPLQTLAKVKTMNTFSGEAGGFTVFGDFSTMLVEEKAAISKFREFVNVVTTSSNPYNATRVEGAEGANQDIFPNGIQIYAVNEVKEDLEGESEVKWGTIDIQVHDFVAQTRLSTNLVDDSEFNITAMLPRWYGTAMGLDNDRQIITGTGVGRPLGILKDPKVIGDATLIQTASTLSDIVPDDLMDLIYKLPMQYRSSPSVGFTMQRSVIKHFRKMKDGQDNFLWQPSFQAGEPERLAGYSILESDFMPDIAPVAPSTKSYPIIFGDWSAYSLVERKSLALQVLRERWAPELKVGYLAHFRYGGQVVQPRAFRLLEVSSV